jgi:hypothetical protein
MIVSMPFLGFKWYVNYFQNLVSYAEPTYKPRRTKLPHWAARFRITVSCLSLRFFF